jgi:hypothetical protein
VQLGSSQANQATLIPVGTAAEGATETVMSVGTVFNSATIASAAATSSPPAGASVSVGASDEAGASDSVGADVSSLELSSPPQAAATRPKAKMAAVTLRVPLRIFLPLIVVWVIPIVCALPTIHEGLLSRAN